MAQVFNIQFSVAHVAANAVLDLAYDIIWDGPDVSNDQPYDVSWQLFGDDTGQDGDDGVAGDDPLFGPWRYVDPLSPNGLPVVHKSWTKEIPWTALNEDTALGGDNDDELRMVVTLDPVVPVRSSFESGRVMA